MMAVRRRSLMTVLVVAVVGAAGLRLLVEVAAPMGTTRVFAMNEAGTAVRLSPDTAALLEGSDVIRGAEYGAFAFYELRSSGLARLDAAGASYERIEHGTEIHITNYHFDPLLALPALPDGLSGFATGGENLVLVQLIGPTQDAWLAAIAATGADRVQYHAQNSYAVWANPAQAEALAALPSVRWVGPYEPAYRLAPELLAASGWVEVSLLAYEPALAEVEEALAKLGALAHQADAPRNNTRYLEIGIDAAQVVALGHIPGVVTANHGWRTPGELDEMSDKISAGMVSGTQPQAKPPGYSDGFLNPAGVDGTGVVVHINDAGVNEGHADLTGRMVAEYGNAANHHGTHVAGIILGSGSGNIGDTNSGGSWFYGLGVAPAAEYVDEYFNCNPADCGRHAITNDANVSSNSWGYTTGGNFRYGYGYTSNSATWDALVQDADDGTGGAQPLSIVGAAGNGGSGSETIGDPWEAKNVLSVASSRNWRNSTGNQGSGDIDSISSFSSRGLCRDGRNCPVVTAPGQNIVSARYQTTGCGAQPAPNSNTHSVCSGTSMATPHVSGIIALITEWWRDSHGQADPSPAMAKAIVVNSAVDMGTDDIPNANEGWGRINVADAILPAVAVEHWDQPLVFGASGEEWTETVQLDDTSKPMKVTLVWTDAPGPGNGGTSAGWVNDLDLRVQQSSTTWRGNNFSGGWSTSGGNADIKNNVENVYLQNPNGGSYTIKVIAANIAGNGVVGNGDSTDQDWALVCTNCSFDGPATPTPTSVGPTATATPSPTPTPLVLTPSDDARVYSGAPNVNYGISNYLRMGTLPDYQSYLKFAVNGVNDPVQSATLRLFAFNGGIDGGGAYTTGTGWTEATITWNNAPGIFGAPLDTHGLINNNQWAEYDVTTAVTGNGTYSFGLKTVSNDFVDFFSKENGATRPELVIIVSQPPTATPTATNTSVPPTATATATNTPVPPTATATATNTSVPPTATPTRTNTPIPPTATATATNTPVPPTATPTATNTPVPPTATATATNTPIPPTATATATNTPVPPTATATATNTPVPPTATATATNTPVPPTATPTRTNTPIPPTATATATNTPVPPTATATAPNTLIPPTATPTATNTPVPPTATATATNTPVPPTDTATATDTPIPPTATATVTNTPVPPTNTATATDTPIAPTANPTGTSTSVPSTATPTRAPVTYVFISSADARVNAGAPTTNYGASTYVQVSLLPTHHTYMRFAVAGVNGTVQRARVRLYATNGSNDGGDVYAVSNFWNEYGITWNNAPAITGTPLDSLGTVGTNQWAEYDVTAAVSGNGIFSFGWKDGSSDVLQCNSRETASNRPQLVLEVIP
jgi:hypothetical protein